ncbi:unnamed protein product [Adineta steineri]|uniref:Uncharacterized protein n=1 Tax=Adineta steineri TaxID=433720 RepID=A0A819WMP2_9BILA|nr:unnamed protein product [Adineta steineri]
MFAQPEREYALPTTVDSPSFITETETTLSEPCVLTETDTTLAEPVVLTETDTTLAEPIVYTLTHFLSSAIISVRIITINSLCDEIQRKIETDTNIEFPQVESYCSMLMTQVAGFKSILPPPSSSSSSSGGEGSNPLEQFIKLLRALRKVVRVAKILANFVAWKWPNPITLKLVVVLGVVDAILTLIIATYDIVCGNQTIWNALLEIISALLEFLPFTHVPNANKIKDIGQKGCTLVQNLQTTVQLMESNPTIEDLKDKAGEIGKFFISLGDFANEVASTRKYGKCYCECNGADKLGFKATTCTWFPNGQFSTGGCTYCDSRRRKRSLETIRSVSISSGPFLVQQCSCTRCDSSSIGYRGTAEQCQSYCQLQATLFINNEVTVTYLPDVQVSKGACKCCGHKDPCFVF